MSDETPAPEGEITQEGTAATEPLGMQEAFEAAEAALGTLPEESASQAADTPAQAPQAAPGSPGTAAEEPEHVRWAKRIDGYFDPGTGQFAHDRIIKGAFELNRQNQSQAQQIQQIRQALQDPDLRAYLEARRRGQPAAPIVQPREPTAEKTDEQILEDFVLERAQKAIQPIVERLERLAPRVEQYRQQQVVGQVDQAYTALREEFGQDAAGGYVYDMIAPQIADAFDSAATRLGATREQLVGALVDRGQLVGTIRSIARDIDWERQRQFVGRQLAAAQSADVESKRRTRLSPGRGTPSGQVTPSRKIESISDAWEAAEAEITNKAS